MIAFLICPTAVLNFLGLNAFLAFIFFGGFLGFFIGFGGGGCPLSVNEPLSYDEPDDEPEDEPQDPEEPEVDPDSVYDPDIDSEKDSAD